MMQLLFAAFLVSGLTGKIQGEVRDEATGQPISYANVVILNTEIGATCDEGGNFFILNVPPGRYRVEVSCMGYQLQRIDGVTVEVDQTARLKVAQATIYEVQTDTLTTFSTGSITSATTPRATIGLRRTRYRQYYYGRVRAGSPAWTWYTDWSESRRFILETPGL